MRGEVREQMPNQPKILIVEDDSELLAAYTDGLSSHYEIKSYSDGSQVESEDFEWADVMVTDFNMPNKNGIELMQDMLLSGFEVPVIFVSGFVPELLKELKTVHIIEVLAKPVSNETLQKYLNLYSDFSLELTRLRNSIMTNISHSRELNERVSQFNKQKHAMLERLRQNADQLGKS